MSEFERCYEAQPPLKLFQVVKIHDDTGRRAVIIDLMQDYPDSVGTSEIIDEGSNTERLAFSGTTPISMIEPTREIWDQIRVVDGIVASYGKEIPGIRSTIEGFFPI